MSVFSYDLPPGLIAQVPLTDRAHARLMIVEKDRGRADEVPFAQIGDFLEAGDLLVLNDARVVPARIHARKETGGKLEIFLLAKAGPFVWEALCRGKAGPGRRFSVGSLSGVVQERTARGTYLVRFDSDDEQELKRHGSIPLPPYIRRAPDRRDEEYYQTVYASRDGAVAAPTAGLHFTGPLLDTLRAKGIRTAFLTLYLGWASFRPVKNEQEAVVPEESFEIPGATAAVVNAARAAGRRVCAVGTSTVRALESSVAGGEVVARKGATSLFIKPGFEFRAVSAMVTNFHLPGSTHLYMVCAFGGTEAMREVYTTAVAEQYRFYSYGDAMLIL